MATSLAAVSPVRATVTVDRDYTFGGDSLEFASDGAIVGSSNSAPLAPGATADSEGPSGAFQDLLQSGGASYIDVSPNGLNRPGAGFGQDGFGVQFDGVDDLLSGIPLNRPDEVAVLVENAGGSFPLNYDGITARGLQLWVYPEQAALGSGTFQSIVFDTAIAGGPAINEAGFWTQSNGLNTNVDPIPATVPVASGDTWFHVQQHVYLDGDAGAPVVIAGTGLSFDFTSVVYVDGIAVSVNNDALPLGGAVDRVDQLVVGAAEAPGDGVTATFENFFDGSIDDLELYVFGENTAGEDFGAFDLFVDNDFIAEQVAQIPGGVLLPGDINLDGVVNGDGTGDPATDDVAAFVDGFGSINFLQGSNNFLFVGDWGTRQQGDFNLDGVVDFADFFILRANHPDAASLSGVAALLAGTVPEPSSAVIVATLLGGLLGTRRRELIEP